MSANSVGNGTDYFERLLGYGQTILGGVVAYKTAEQNLDQADQLAEFNRAQAAAAAANARAANASASGLDPKFIMYGVAAVAGLVVLATIVPRLAKG